ncbi:Signal peptidase complex catalytic subunit, partial [Nowakowskiella sp. JEL0407]
MEPAFQRGDVLFLYNSSAPVKVGDICVFNIPNARSKIPVVHRFLWIHEHSVTRNEASRQYLKSKGDNNPVDDYLGGIYPREREWMNQENLVGTVYAMTPSWG